MLTHIPPKVLDRLMFDPAFALAWNERARVIRALEATHAHSDGRFCVAAMEARKPLWPRLDAASAAASMRKRELERGAEE
jgi:hypothetical protein